LKEEQDTDNRFEIEFKKETDHQEGMLLANLKEAGVSEKTEDSADAGIAAAAWNLSFRCTGESRGK